jgi:predicted glycogen debranching enzyme
LPELFLGPHTLSHYARAIGCEWIITNGLGGYASSTALNIHTRKYHGLLVAALNPPVKRFLLLSKIDEEAWINDHKHPFYSNEYTDSVHPDGYKRLTGFALNPFPTFYYASSGVYLTKRLFMPHLQNAVVISYEVLNTLKNPVAIRLTPSVNFRHFFEVTDNHACPFRFEQTPKPNGVILDIHPHTQSLTLSSTAGQYRPDAGIWHERLYFRVDKSRGESYLDDNYQPGAFSVNIAPKEKKQFSLIATSGEPEVNTALLQSTISEDALRRIYLTEINRRTAIIRDFYQRNAEVKETDWLNWLLLSADSFLVTRRSTGTRSVLAGYHWFEDWGRDALISLPGLTLITGRYRQAEEILLTFKHYLKNGLLPNRFPDQAGDTPVYDSVDTTLWFFNAILQYLKYTGNLAFVQKELWDTLQSIITEHVNGTLFGIRLDGDGLLSHGPRLTWMDVSIHGSPCTPRDGKAVEIQALWYNALRLMETLARELEGVDDAQRYKALAEKAEASFNKKFWCSERNCLFDVIKSDEPDLSLRPNQIIPVFLDFSILDPSRSCNVVETVWKELWGTYGLQTLSTDDAKYVGRYAGSISDRDRAYHNGTVWTWLLGPFVTSFLKVKRYAEDWRKFAFTRFMRPLFLDATYAAGLGTLSEIYDGDFPRYPKGCISQAWSVAEPLRALLEDVFLKRPPYEQQLLTSSQRDS